MKKRYYVVATIFLMFLLFLVFVFAGGTWVECTKQMFDDGVPLEGKYCCYTQGSYQWQASECPQCTDNDGDGYGDENGNYGIANGCKYDAPDCDDDDPTVHALINCEYDGTSFGNYQLCLLSCPVPPQEICDGIDNDCDGIDNDCDGSIDEDYVSNPTTCGTGACASTGVTSCVNGVVVDSCTPGTPAANDATCNNVDDDCDGSIDEDYVSNPTTCGTGACASTGVTSCVNGVVVDSCTPGTPAAEICDSTDKDCDGLIDCQDPDCAGSVSGRVKDTDDKNIQGARIDAVQDVSPKYTKFTQASGKYQIDDVLCGPYDMIASAAKYVSSTQAIELQPNQQLENVDFTLIFGTTCKNDCTYAGDNTVHAECDRVDVNNDGQIKEKDDCVFCDDSAKQVCNLAQPGWIRNYDENNVVECGEGCPYEKKEVKAKITCEEENLIKITKLVQYKGKLVKLVIITCG